MTTRRSLESANIVASRVHITLGIGVSAKYWGVQMTPHPTLFPTALEMLGKRRRHAAYFYHFYVNGIPKLPVEMLP